MIWNDPLPADCPFERSKVLSGLAFTGRSRNYTNADTWYPAWGNDDILYSPWTDGCFGETVKPVLDCSSKSDDPSNAAAAFTAATGQARIIGSDPMDLVVENLGISRASSAPYGGRYPSASLMVDGVWYYGTYCLDESGRTDPDGNPYNWDILGPLVGFRVSRDRGATWTDTARTPSAPLFGEPNRTDGRIRFGAPHFVDFGRNMRHAPGGMAYLVGHGAADRHSRAAWIRGDEVNLCRVRPTPETINDAAAYQFFAGHDERGSASWTETIDKMKPLLRWDGHLGHVTITHVPPLGRFLMCVTDGGDTISSYDSYILEADVITGPWRVVACMKEFGDQAYFLNFPSRFISADGLTLWLCFSANFTSHHLGFTRKIQPANAKYAMSLHEVRLSRI